MCNWGNTAKVRLMKPKEISGKIEVNVDRYIAPLVQLLNDCGIETISSCCGHGKMPASIILNGGLEITILDINKEKYKEI